jgi:uncharacterized membrane protein
MNLWVLAGTTFLASAVEFVEAATIVLAVGYTQGWRAAIGGTVAACVALAAIIALFGPMVVNAASLHGFQVVIGAFLVLFGIAWLRKAVWRFAGRKAQRNEVALYERDVEILRADREHRRGFAMALQGVFLEGLEVAVIVVTFGAASGGALTWSTAGALAAFVVVLIAAIALHKPFGRVPENAMKAIVGLMLLSLGTFWMGEGLAVQWWLGDVTLFLIVAIYAATAWAMTAILRERVPA